MLCLSGGITQLSLELLDELLGLGVRLQAVLLRQKLQLAA